MWRAVTCCTPTPFESATEVTDRFKSFLDPRQSTGEGFAFWIAVVITFLMIAVGWWLLAGELP